MTSEYLDRRRRSPRQALADIRRKRVAWGLCAQCGLGAARDETGLCERCEQFAKADTVPPETEA